jgi:hypothetical protein
MRVVHNRQCTFRDTDIRPALHYQVNVIWHKAHGVDSETALSAYRYYVFEQAWRYALIEHCGAKLCYKDQVITQNADTLGELKSWGLKARIAISESRRPLAAISVVSSVIFDISSSRFKIGLA